MQLPAAASSFFLMVTCLLAVDLVSWKRTSSIRRGTIPRPSVTSDGGFVESSRSTLLAAWAGVAAAAWGGVATATGRGPIEAAALIAAGTVVAIAGFVARVTGVRANADGLVVLFAGLRPFGARWTDILELRPPGTPVGGWRVTDVHGVRTTLMPSDLLGHEDVLALVVLRARLRFEVGKWIKGSSGEPNEGNGPGVSHRRW